MRKNYCFLLALLLGVSVPALAQYEFKDNAGTGTNGLGPYTQNFDELAGTNATFTSNVTMKGVYTRYTLDGLTAEFESKERPRFGSNGSLSGVSANSPIPGDDGTKGTELDTDGQPSGAGWYHFGETGSADRALGGIAATNTASGKGYIGIRLKNSSSKLIKNLEVEYAMEQWYNSSKTQAANIEVAWKKGVGNISTTNPYGPYLSASTGWNTVAALGVAAPSTSTTIAPRNGNAITNRRVLRTTLANLNLAAGEEVMIRWVYVFNTASNGNGLSIDDVVITPQTNIFYSTTTGDLNQTASWGINEDGTGGGLTNFTANNTTYYVRGVNATTDRISGSQTYPNRNTWTVSGTNSKVIVGTPSTAATLFFDNNDDLVGKLDVGPGSTLICQQPAYSFTLNALDKTSTVEYRTTDNSIAVAPVSYGNLKLSGSAVKTLGGDVLVNNTLTFATAGTPARAPMLELGNYDLTIQRDGAIQGTTMSAFIVTNGSGTLRQSVKNNATDVLYPVGSADGSYTPVWLQQPFSTTALNEDVFSVRVIDGLYRRYDANENGVTGTLVETQNVKKTWLVSEEVAGNSNITMALQWNNADEVKGAPAVAFDRAMAYVSHYLTNARNPYFDKPEAGQSSVSGTRAVRSGITSFSPFAVSSRAVGPLPVSLVAFGAVREGSEVRCTWKTASEQGNKQFVVERSANGHAFAALGTVAGHGTTAAAQAYTFFDSNPLPGLAYYRLRQEDTDGTATYSPVVTVQGCASCAGMPAVLVAAPNPGTGVFQLRDANNAAASVTGTVRNLMGQTVRQLHNEAVLDLTTQPAGVYLLQVDAAQGPVVVRLVKE